jgi:hypothetical protein
MHVAADKAECACWVEIACEHERHEGWVTQGKAERLKSRERTVQMGRNVITVFSAQCSSYSLA